MTTATEIETVVPEQHLPDSYEVIYNPKGTYARIRVGGRTLGYADLRKDGYVLNVADRQGWPQRFEKALATKGVRRTLRVTTKNLKTAEALLEWMGKQA